MRVHKATDPTEKTYENTLLESVFAYAPQAVLLSDLEGKLIKANERAAELFGYSPEELLQKSILQLMPEVEHAGLEGLKAATSIPYETYGLHAHRGKIRLLLHQILPTADRNFALYYIDVHARSQGAISQMNTIPEAEDGRLRNYTEELERKVSERTRELSAMVKKLVETNLSLEYQMHETQLADAQAKKNYALYVAIARYFPKVMIVVINREHRIVFLDGEELQKIGLDKQRVEGLSIEEVHTFSEQWKKQMSGYAYQTFAGGHYSYEIRHRNNNYKVNTMPLEDGQLGVNLVMFVFTNISEQKRTELKMLKALKKERELSELKSRFVSMASHEFRTPLSTILSSANLIARQNEAGKEDKRLRNVERIKSSVKNLVDILNEFLSIGKLEEGEVQMKKEQFDLIKFLNSIIQELQHVRKEGQKVLLQSEMHSIPVFLDPQFTRNVFLNLLSNALKYSPPHKNVYIKIQSQEGALSVVVADEGIGIPEDEQKNLFNLFFRARNVTNIEGTGLGLPIVQKYIALMNGKITFKSKLEQGTTFTISLPLE